MQCYTARPHGGGSPFPPAHAPWLRWLQAEALIPAAVGRASPAAARTALYIASCRSSGSCFLQE